MDATQKGWVIFALACGSVLAEIGLEIRDLTQLSEMATPAFIGSAMWHVGVVIGTFLAGKNMPTTPR